MPLIQVARSKIAFKTVTQMHRSTYMIRLMAQCASHLHFSSDHKRYIVVIQSYRVFVHFALFAPHIIKYLRHMIRVHIKLVAFDAITFVAHFQTIVGILIRWHVINVHIVIAVNLIKIMMCIEIMRQMHLAHVATAIFLVHELHFQLFEPNNLLPQLTRLYRGVFIIQIAIYIVLDSASTMKEAPSTPYIASGIAVIVLKGQTSAHKLGE
mmetsp:Transcript_15428/g.23502  ORF Transcript_15428/g.23502 Transcript_15428/m.23502 type:complete len:210 (+) Transcript_15428:302-931(+)